MKPSDYGVPRRGVSAATAIALVALVTAAAAAGLALTNRPSTSESGQSAAPQSRSFVVIVEEQGFNETAGIPNYTFSPTSIVVDQGDTVTVNFYNTDTAKHTFTIGAPYNVNLEPAGNTNESVTFVASHPGVFLFYCMYHLPTMEGQFVVLAD